MPNFKLIKALLAIGTVILFSGCGQVVTETVSPMDSTTVPIGQTQSVVMLPLADYSQGVSPDESLRRQIKIHSAVAHELARHGYYLPVEEDVYRFLIDKGIITVIQQDSGNFRRRDAFRRELGSGWSPEMLKRIEGELDAADRVAAGGRDHAIKVNRVGLDRTTIREIGRTFNSRYLLRGRIVEYEVREGHSFDPKKKGLLPFFLDTSSASLFGVARSEQYDLWQDLAIGAALGGGTAVMSASSGKEGDQGLIWGGIGGSVAYLANKGGHIPSGVVQVSLALQDVETGRVVWANRIEKQVEPESVFADPRERSQIDLAVEQAAIALAQDLAAVLPGLTAETTSMAQTEPAVLPLPPSTIPVEAGTVPLAKEKVRPIGLK